MATNRGRKIDIHSHKGTTIKLGHRFRLEGSIWKVGRMQQVGAEVEIAAVLENNPRRMRYVTPDEFVEAREKGFGRLANILEQAKAKNHKNLK